MKLVIFLICFLSLASADFLDVLRNYEIISEGKHEPLIQAIRNSKVEITQKMFADAIKTVYDNMIVPQLRSNDVNVENIKCGITLLEILEAIMSFESIQNSTEHLWPIFMIDPWAKIQSGFLAGNIRNPGHFTQCINMDVPIDTQTEIENVTINNMRGKHCTVGIRGYIESDFEWPVNIIPPPAIFDIGEFWPEGLFMDFGICFPAVCNDVIIDTIFRILLAYLGLEPTPLFTNNRDKFCSTAESPPLEVLDIGALVLLGLGVAGIIISTIYEVICNKLDVKPNELTAAMSALSNGRYLFNLHKNKEHIQCLYGLRALSLIWLMLGYRFILSMVMPLINPLDFVFDFNEGYFSPIVFASQFGVDAILFLNATLITFLFMTKIDRTGKVRIWKMYLYRFMRVTPFIGILIFLLMTLTKYSSEGPYYHFITGAQIPNCEQYWWAAMLHVQNYVNPDQICILHTWMFSVDMQLYWAAPLVLFPLYFFGSWFILFIILVVILAIACASTVSYLYDFQAFFLRMLLDFDKVLEYLRMIFFATHIRMGPWLIGIICGYLCFRLRNGRTKIAWLLATCLWILAISGIISVIYLLHPFQQILPNKTGTLTNIMYIGFARNIFALCLAWIVIGCYTGSGYIINWILSLSIWMPLARMSISVYIVTLSAQMVIIASQKTPLVFGSMEFLHAFNGDIVLVTIFSTLTFLMIERPIMRVMKFLLSIGTTKKNSEKEEIVTGNHEVTFERIEPWKSWY